MSQFTVDPATGELQRSGGQFVRVDGLPEVAQHVRVRLRLFAGECVFDQQLGVEYVERLMRKGVPVAELATAFREAVHGTPGVEAVTDVEVTQTAGERATRRASVRFEAAASVEALRDQVVIHDQVTVAVQE